MKQHLPTIGAFLLGAACTIGVYETARVVRNARQALTLATGRVPHDAEPVAAPAARASRGERPVAARVQERLEASRASAADPIADPVAAPGKLARLETLKAASRGEVAATDADALAARQALLELQARRQERRSKMAERRRAKADPELRAARLAALQERLAAQGGAERPGAGAPAEGTEPREAVDTGL